MNFNEFKQNLLMNEMIYFLNKNTSIDLFNLLEKSIYLKSCYEFKTKPKNFSLRINDPSIERLEKLPCIKSLLKKTKLNHKERFSLLCLYIPLEEIGEQRLMEILSKQSNFKESICRQQIDNYKQQGKFFGISCKKLKEWGICNNGC